MMNPFCGVCGNVGNKLNMLQSCFKCGVSVHKIKCHLGSGTTQESVRWECAMCYADASTELGDNTFQI